MPEVNTDWQELVINGFVGGLNKNKKPDRISDNETPDVKNLIFDDDVLKTDYGYDEFLGTTRGDPRLITQLAARSGTTTLCLVTDDTFYIENNDEWQYVSDGNDTTCTDGEPAGETDVVVASITGFSDADYIGVILDDGSQHQTIINGAPSGSTIVMTDAVPAGRSISVSAILLKAKDLSGATATPVSHVAVASNDWIVFTNGVDVVQRYDGDTVEDVPNLPQSGNTICTAVELFKNHLLLLGTIEGGTAYPQRVRWSDTGDPTNWSTGNASFEDQYETPGHIRLGLPLGPYMIVYKEDSIIRMEYVGSDDLLFNFNTVVTKEGCISTNGATRVGDHHIVVGNSDIYEYRGSFDYDPIGENINNKLLNSAGELNPSAQGMIFCGYVEELNEFWVVYPSGSATISDSLLRYYEKKKVWSYREFANSFLCMAFYTADSTVTWSELEGTWIDQDWNWNSKSVLANAPIVLLGSDTPNQVYSYDYIASTDASTDIDWLIQTKLLIHQQYKVRIDSILIHGLGDITIEYSVDQGLTWLPYGSITGSAAYEITEIFKQITSRSIIFQLSGTGAAGINRAILNYRLESQ